MTRLNVTRNEGVPGSIPGVGLGSSRARVRRPTCSGRSFHAWRANEGSRREPGDAGGAKEAGLASRAHSRLPLRREALQRRWRCSSSSAQVSSVRPAWLRTAGVWRVRAPISADLNPVRLSKAAAESDAISLTDTCVKDEYQQRGVGRENAARPRESGSRQRAGGAADDPGGLRCRLPPRAERRRHARAVRSPRIRQPGVCAHQAARR